MIHAAELPEARDVPIQYFQSIIAVLLAVSGALLFQVRFFDNDRTERGSQVDPRLRLVMVLVLTATLFGSLRRCERVGVPLRPRS